MGEDGLSYTDLITSGLTHEEAVRVMLGSRGPSTSRPSDERGALGEFGAGAALGGTQALTSLGEGLGIAGQFILPEQLEGPATQLRESSQELERKAEEYFDPQGGAGTAGRFTGRILGEVAATVGTLGAGRAVAPASALNAFRTWANGSRIKSGLAAASAELPLSVPRALSYAEETGRPFSRELAIEIAGSGIGGALFPAGIDKVARSASRFGLINVATGKRSKPKAPTTDLLGLYERSRFLWVDEFVPIMAAARRMGGRQKEMLLNGKLAQMEGSSRKAMQYAQTNIGNLLKLSGKAERELAEASAIRHDFELRLQARDELSVLQQDIKTASGADVEKLSKRIQEKKDFIELGKLGISPEEITRLNKDVMNDPELVSQTDQLRNYFKGLQAERLNQELPGITQRQLDDMVAKRAFYSPFVEDYSTAIPDGGAVFAGRTNRFKPTEGAQNISTSKVGDGTIYQSPLERAVAETFTTFADIGKYNVGKTFSNTLEETGGELLDGSGKTIIKRVGKEEWEKLSPTKRWRHELHEAEGDVTSVFGPAPGRMSRYYEIGDDDLFHAMTQEGSEASGIAMRLAKAAADFKRKSITILPDFSVAAIIRDWPIYAVQRASQRGASAVAESALGAGAGAAVGAGLSEEDDRLSGALAGAGLGAGFGMMARPGVEIAGGLTSIVRGSRLAKKNSKETQNFINNASTTAEGLYQALGPEIGITDGRRWLEFVAQGGQTSGQTYGAATAHELISRMSKEEKLSIIGLFGKSAKGVYRTLEFIGQAAENAPRVAMYQQLRKAGVEVPEAVFAAQDVTLPFARRGALKSVKNVSEVTPFFNASLKGFDKTLRLFRGDPDKNRAPAVAQSLAALATAIMAPTVALWKINKDNPEYWDRPLWERNLFWLVPKPDGGFHRLPKPFELGYAFASLPERAMDEAAKSGEISSAAQVGTKMNNEFLKSIVDISKGSATGTIPIPAAIQPIIEIATNKDLFRWKAIEPEYLKTRPASQRYTTRTSILSRGIADVANSNPLSGALQLSPLRVEAILNSLGGTTARRAMQLVDAVGAETGRSTPSSAKTTEERISQVIGSARFGTQNYDVGEIEYQAYNILKRSSDITAHYNRMRTTGTSRFLVNEFKDQHKDEIRVSASLKSAYSEMRSLRQQRNEVLNNESLSDEVRRRRLDRIQDRGRRLGSRVFNRINQIVD